MSPDELDPISPNAGAPNPVARDPFGIDVTAAPSIERRLDVVPGREAPERVVVPVGRADDVHPGLVKVVRAAGREIAVFKLDDEFCAIDNACPHHGASLADGPMRGEEVQCPWHFWTVNVRTGACWETPSRPVETFETTTVDGMLFVHVPILPARPPIRGILERWD